MVVSSQIASTNTDIYCILSKYLLVKENSY